MSVGVRVSTYMAVDPFNVCVCLEASLHVRGCFNLCTPLSARISAPPPVSVCVQPCGGVFWPSQSSGEGGVIFHSDRQQPTQGGPGSTD